MKARTLRETLERHRRVLRSPTVHVMSDERATYVTSSLLSGHVFRTRLEGTDNPLSATVSSELLLSMVPAQDRDVVLACPDRELSITCGRNRGQLTSMEEEPPIMPVPTKGADAHMDAKTIAWLRQVLPSVNMQRIRTDGTSSIIGNGEQLEVCAFNETHGAFASRAGATIRVSLGLLPPDLSLLQTILSTAEQALVSACDDNRLLARVGTDSLALPCVEAMGQTREARNGATRPHWRVLARDLQEAVQAVAVVATSKDAGPVQIAREDGELVISARSPGVGKIRRAIRSEGNDHVRIGCNIELLQDLVGSLPKDAEVVGAITPGDSPSERLVLHTGSLTYVMLTDGE